ncbi:MAG: short-chain fatty acyl-CoA regulator family protein [Myxococcota bacterium]
MGRGADAESKGESRSPSNNADLGRRLRALRLERGLAQGEVARRLAVSPAYLSLIEQGKRAMQLPLLFAALELFGVPAEAFMDSLAPKDAPSFERLRADPVIAGLGIDDAALKDLAGQPGALRAFEQLVERHRQVRGRLEGLMGSLEGERRSEDQLRFDVHPFEEIASFLETHSNYFASLEHRADGLRDEASLGEHASSRELASVLSTHLDVRVVEDTSGSVLQRWDGQTLTLGRGASEGRRRFRLARGIALALFEREGLHESLLEGHAGAASTLIKIHLANYFAGALLLPYGAFFAAVEEARYDVELVATRFSTSYESVAHRICTLGDPKRRGVPMHFVRVDAAGNITKRYAGDRIPLSRDDRSCPKLAAHLAFLSPNTLTKQYVVYPDGRSYFTFAKVVGERRGGSVARGTLYSVGLGCRAADAPRLAYADDMPFADPERMAVPVGTSCRLCERKDCRMRSAPSYQHRFRMDESVMRTNFFAPDDEGER